jgi:hypothetical protein
VVDIEGKRRWNNKLCVASGHIADYLFHHQNLYIYSQQELEALNMLIKQVYFQHTSHGVSGQLREEDMISTNHQMAPERLVFIMVENLRGPSSKIRGGRK